MSVMVMRWENPPANQRRGERRDWASVAQALKERPGQWAAVAEGNRSTVSQLVAQIRSGILVPFRPAGAYDATSRCVDSVITVYARFIGTCRICGEISPTTECDACFDREDRAAVRRADR